MSSLVTIAIPLPGCSETYGRNRWTFQHGGRAVLRYASAPIEASLPMAGVWADGRPVSFCYPVWQTESWWDVAIETLEGYRRKGFAGRAAQTLIRHMRRTGRAPVWGALDTNAGSRALAGRLGFREAARIAVFTAA